MNPVHFAEANTEFKAPAGLSEDQCFTLRGYYGAVSGGSLDGSCICVSAWQPTPEEIAQITAGRPMFLSFIGGMPAHYPSMDFHTATHPA